MISMTGYGEASFIILGIRFYYRIRSLNSRFLEIFLFFPTELRWFESKIDKTIRNRFIRGKIEVYLESAHGIPKHPTINSNLMKEYQKLFLTLYPENKKIIPMETLAQLPGFFELSANNLKSHQPKLESYLFRALMRLERAKTKEGRKIYSYIKTRLRLLSRTNHKIKILHHQIYQKQKKQVDAKFLKYIQSCSSHGTTLKTKDHIFPSSSKNLDNLKEEIIHYFYSDITEEMDRLNIHLTTMLELIEVEQSVGKKLEFFLQEILREVNTLTAKTKDSRISQHGIQMKTDIEKIREQIRNVE